ncbi:similar to Saccharomyces cerevisiae YOR267C HRK1 Protein kinase implicated in activation of the plasma membrane H(+)-ATPase Pma1p in response to glucose metabolism [Maudiozyma saulgeensis]|uniref:non-specific serine/threonine protein kinase n=1 Tax=Maudiozyma saulgeensis TaxID=1789683 RepID=A0A1X7R8U2_9SACH|nr:similar to Saccharomyces cerevisiae YOR267C HRK1 Protein kinase implicated in activation of the plasma membrane H(+)-ATPase Pma1p in response to glucose metabolism [Kazachstania saulgeensis]
MPKLLSGSLFHHSSHDHVSSTITASSLQHSVGDEDTIQPVTENSPPALKSTRSFLGFIGKNNSNKSTDSLKSQDQSHVNNISNHNHKHNDDIITPKPSNSMLELKRFFRPPIHKKPQSIHPHPPIQHTSNNVPTSRQPNKLSSTMKDTLNNNKKIRSSSPGGDPGHTQSAIPPSTDSGLSLANNINIYHDDTILAQKYGKLGKTLGTGAGGSVKILVRPSDNAIFAVKEFRPRKTSESIKEYAKKCTAEFLVGSSLHHSNVVQTMDVFSDSKQNKYFEVMEYLPVDFFAVVMTGKMSRGEINCCFKQICHGVKYLHSMGLAHRDLKLDNCCMNEFGILKLIDFGSAVIFRYPFENKIIKCHGIVGSDPYLAPEVLNHSIKYDPQFVDIWSIGIIFCCMMLKRFPWKVPKDSDDNYRLYRLKDNIEHDYIQSAKHHEELLKQRKEIKNQQNGIAPTSSSSKPNDNDESEKPKDKKSDDDNDNESSPADNDPSPKIEKLQIDDTIHNDKKKSDGSHHKKTIQGPYRLLRLLPHASRPIISKILLIDPQARATFKDIYDDEWFDSIPTCTMDIDKKTVQRAQGHHHTLVREEDNKVLTYKV